MLGDRTIHKTRRLVTADGVHPLCNASSEGYEGDMQARHFRPSARSWSRRQWMAGVTASLATWGLGGCVTSTTRARATALQHDGGLEPHMPPPIARAEYRQRQAAAQSQLSAADLCGLILVGSSNLTYFTGVRWRLSERFFAWVLPREGEPVFICPAFEAARAQERIGEGARVRLWQEHEDPFGLLPPLFNGPGRLAFDASGPWHFARRIMEKSERTLVDASAIVGPLRRRKSPHELRLMAYANGITRRAIHSACQRLEEGVRGSQIGAWVRAEQTRRGGAHPWVLPLIGAAAAFPHGTADDPPLKKGDSVLIDAGCQVHGYWSDLTRTVFFEEPPAPALTAWHAVKDAQQAAFDAIAPGVTAGAVDTAARHALAASGYSGDYGHLTHRLGHGIGLDVHETPYFVKDNMHRLEPGNTLSNEPGIYVPDQFGVRLEDIVVVTTEGARFLSTPQRHPTAAGI